MSLIEIKDLKRHYEMTSETVKALDGINLTIEEGERVILLGPSGSGKTTLLNCISALDVPTDGKYIFAGKEVPRDKSEQMTTFRRENIGYVFQFFNLLQDLTVLENILLIQELADGKDQDRALKLLKLVGLEAETNRFPAEISGGQQQRVAIARSIAKKPRLLLGDELTGNLDTETSTRVMKTLVSACESEKITAIFVTHDESLIQFATRVIRIDSGKIISDEKVA
ncbi:MAG: ABC transporter ATP-binding protein [Euryarchaeota archaeon]|nr:ABC transporter ATP-binding protein [Euryarchaeota archaeon]|tara:strand:- start:2773 stop:3450 length:678 start_codon:yes stop_codon:yes gene_type:complete